MPLASAICHLANEKNRAEKVGEVYLALALLNIHPFFVGQAKSKKKKERETTQHVSFVYLLMFTNFHGKMKKVFAVFDKVKLFLVGVYIFFGHLCNHCHET